MMNINARLVEQAKIVTGLGPVTPSSSTPDHVNLKHYPRCTVIIQALNGTTVTGSAITLVQSTDVANTGGKTLSFDKVFANVDTGASDTLVDTTVSSNTFTTNSTNSKGLLYVIEVTQDMLDTANSFNCFRVGTGNAANTTLSVTYVLWPARFAQATPPSAIT